MSPDTIAPKGKIWVCCACGKTSRDRYGGETASSGWDESCAINSALYDEKAIVRGRNGRVVDINGTKTEATAP